MNNASSSVHTSSQWLISTSTATAPAAARSTKPNASVSTSTMTMCLRGPEYNAWSTRYVTATSVNIEPSESEAAIDPAASTIAAVVAVGSASAPEAMGRVAFVG